MAKGIAELLLERGAAAVSRAAGALLSDPRGQEALARAVGAAQRGVQVFATVQERALHAAGLAARPDYDDLRKQIARLKRKARALSSELQGASTGRSAPEPGNVDGAGAPEGGGSH